jgi:hypothetical protein
MTARPDGVHVTGFCLGLACGYLWGYRSAIVHLGGRLHQVMKLDALENK